MFNLRLLFAAMTFGRFGGKPSIPPDAERRAERQVSGMARARYIRNRSCYSPHQGRQEIQRRRSQIVRGILATN